jgi:drug/metabolite transporter (DMT)-like permease
MGVISGAVLLGEGITAILVAGLVCVLAGIYMVNRPAKVPSS